MDRSLFTCIIDDIASWPRPPEEVVPTNFGELFMNKSWYAMLQEISAKVPKTAIKLVTTGLLLTTEAIESLAMIPTLSYVNFSVNAYFEETWARVHKVPGKHMKRVLDSIHAFRDRRPDVEVNVSMVHDPELTTELEKDMFITYWSQFGSYSISNVSFANHPTRRPVEPVKLPCRSVFDGLVIFDDGKVGPGCCFDGDAEPELNIGVFPEQKLLDIWRGEKLKKLCELHNSGRRAELGICKTCTFA